MDSPEDILMAWNEAWHILTTSIASSLWTRRNDRVYNQHIQPISVQAQQIFSQASHQLEAISSFRAKNPERTSWLWWVVKHIKDPPKTAFITTRLRLFFDGGSRGNPGLGGSGWIILEKRSDTWFPLQAGWEYHQPPCTNNQSELSALRAGLKVALQNTNTSHTFMEVIGDSQFVQKLLLAQYRSNKYKCTAKAVHKLLAQFCQISILHTRRKWNTMADHLANKAMDMLNHGCLTAAQLQNKIYQELISNDSQFTISTTQSYRNLGSISYI
jgi:ribonuclease HI